MRYIISLALTSLTLASAAQAEVPKVVTDIPPVHALTAQVMGDLGTPVLLLTTGASEHDFQLRPSQAQDIENAGLVVWIGPELTPWLERALTGLGPAQSLALLDAPDTMRRDFSADGAHMRDDHAGHVGHADEEADGHDDHDHSGTDPHAWLDPANAKIWLGLIAAKLGAIDPENAATYAANATAAQARIDTLDARITAQLAAVKDRPIVVYHDAYGYLAAHYGLKIFGSVALGDATAPGAAKLSALQTALQGGNATCLFPEAQHDPALAEQLVQGTPLRLGAPLDPVGSTLPTGPDAYDALMSGLANAITDCLGAV